MAAVTGGTAPLRRRAVVLGGGGPVGVAWQIGLAAGLADEGVELAAAGSALCTSAGSITGALLLGGGDVGALADEVVPLFASGLAGSGADRLPVGLAQVTQLLLAAGAEPRASQRERMAEVGRIALAAPTISEDAFVGTLAPTFAGQPWPRGFRCTAVDAETGDFVVWDADAGVALERAIASSCAVPGVYPAITIDGRRYVDGGVRSPLNADRVGDADVVVAVSVTALSLPPGFRHAELERFLAARAAELDGVRAAGAALEVIEPDSRFLEISGYGMALLDFGRLEAAAVAGRDLGRREARRIGATWG